MKQCWMLKHWLKAAAHRAVLLCYLFVSVCRQRVQEICAEVLMYCVLKSALTDWGWDLRWQLSIFKRTICLISTTCLYVWCCVESPFYSCIYLRKHYDKWLKCCFAFSTFCRFLPCTPILLAEQAIVCSYVIRLCLCVFVHTKPNNCCIRNCCNFVQMCVMTNRRSL